MSYAEQKIYRRRRRAQALAYLGGACVRCGSTTGLQFDHADPSTKVIEISQAIVAAWSWRRLIVELDKCQLMCKDHHVEKTRSEGSYGGKPWNKIENPPHGTWACYTNNRCRCAPCKRWRKMYRQGAVDARGQARN